MHTIRRSALVEHSATRMFDLVNDVAAYPRRFDWCSAAELIEQGEARLVARLDLGLGSLRTWFTTENALDRPHRDNERNAWRLHNVRFPPICRSTAGRSRW